MLASATSLRFASHTCGSACCCKQKSSPAQAASSRRAPGRKLCATPKAIAVDRPGSQKRTGMSNVVEWHGMGVMEKGAPLQPYTFKVEPMGPDSDEVDIRITHNGLCHSDVHMQHNDWGYSGFPFVPGHEAVGVVEAVGSRAPAHIKVGMRVGAGWVKNSCRCCKNCIAGNENLCEPGYTALITNGQNGGFADRLRLSGSFVYPIPDAIDSASAAPLLCAGVTVFAPVKRWMKPGMRVAILGVGGLGHLAVQFASKMGGIVTAVDVDVTKEKEAQKLGAAEFKPFVKFVEQANTYDLIINTASAEMDIKAVLNSLANNGTLVQLGLPPDNATMKVPILSLVLGQKRVVGSVVGGRSEMNEMLQFCAQTGIRPMIEKRKLKDVNKAIEYLLSGKPRYRIVLESE